MQTAEITTSDVPTHEQLVERARAMAPEIKALAPQMASERRVLPEIIDKIRQADLFRILKPRRWGGLEMRPEIFSDVQFELARADMSVGWIFGVLGCHNFQMALFDDRAPQDVWGRDNDVLIASTFQPGGRATPAKGGYRFNGRWKFSSGCDHADWVFLGGILEDEFLTCLLPREQYEIVDTWHVAGLKATGSKDILVRDVVIPEYRVHRTSDGFNCDSPGNAVNTGWLYRIPFHQIFLRAITGAAIGGLQGMVDAFTQYASNRVSVVAGATIKDPDALQAVGEAVSTIDELRTIIRRNYSALEVYACQWNPPPFEERLLYKYQASAVAVRCLDAGRRIFENAGGTGLFDDQPFGRILGDLTAAKQHAAAQHQLPARSLGATKLGQDVSEWYL